MPRAKAVIDRRQGTDSWGEGAVAVGPSEAFDPSGIGAGAKPVAGNPLILGTALLLADRSFPRQLGNRAFSEGSDVR